MKEPPRAKAVLFLCLFLWFVAFGRERFFRDPGVFWHTVVGVDIINTGQLPRTDRFSFTCFGNSWVAWEWLWDCAVGLFHTLSGFDGLLFGTAALLAWFYSWVFHRLIRDGLEWPIAALLVMLAVKASSYHFHPRPHLVTLVLLGWMFGRLGDCEAGRRRLEQLFWLVPVFILWTNLHPGVVAGIGTVVVSVTGWAIFKLLGKESPITRPGHWVLLGLLVGCCGLSVFVNPYGIELPRTWLSVIQSPVVAHVINEHQPIMESAVAWQVIPFGLIYLSAILGVLPKWPRVTWLVPLLWLYLAWNRARNGPLFATTAVLALGDLLPEARWMKWLARAGVRAKHSEPRPRMGKAWWPELLCAGFPLGAVMLACLSHTLAVPLPVTGHGVASPSTTHWPFDLLPELRQYESTHARGTAIFNEMKFGGFLIYYTPGLRVFIDDRCELYGNQRLLEYMHAKYKDPGQLERWAEQYGFDRALTERGSLFDLYLRQSAGWRIVRQTAAATLYSRDEINRDGFNAEGCEEPDGVGRGPRGNDGKESR